MVNKSKNPTKREVVSALLAAGERIPTRYTHTDPLSSNDTRLSEPIHSDNTPFEPPPTMTLEACMLVLDNSSYSINGDYPREFLS